MLIETKAFGSMDIDERQCITMPLGLYGFDSLTQFAIIDSRQIPFFWYQSLEHSDTAFVVIDPKPFWPDYDPNIDPDDMDSLQLDGRNDEEFLEFVIVTIPQDNQDITANLQGPIIINKKTRMARQCIARNDSYRVKHLLFPQSNPSAPISESTTDADSQSAEPC